MKVRWADRIIGDEEIGRYLKADSGTSLVARVDALIAHQRDNWPLLKEGYEALAGARTKQLPVAESYVIVQHNPKRIRSTAAQVDSASVAERRCFLCPQNLPDEEKGIAYGDDLIILCNPFPILDRHLSIVHRQHVEQNVYGNVEAILNLARDLAPDYFVLYNGPRSGASAPDHFHLQACARGLLPIEQEARGDDPYVVDGCDSCAETARQTFEVFTLSGCGRSVIVLRGGNAADLALWTYRLLDELAGASRLPEPMVNIICTHATGLWNVYIFPRAGHRPSHFYAEGDDKLLISPGAIDMAGVIVVPERAHFEKVSREDIEEIFAEVSYTEEAANEIVERACASAEEAAL
jgi:Domain of unknown function (DUF4922)